MREVSRSALVPHSAQQMFALVEDIGSYPEFLPWCTDATIHSRDDDVVDASLELQRGSLKKSFRTRNTLQPGVAMGLELLGGPFRHLQGEWRFDQLGDSGSKVSLDLSFEFENFLTDTLFGPYFEDTCNSLVDSFTRRADEIYG